MHASIRPRVIQDATQTKSRWSSPLGRSVLLLSWLLSLSLAFFAGHAVRGSSNTDAVRRSALDAAKEAVHRNFETERVPNSRARKRSSKVPAEAGANTSLRSTPSPVVRLARHVRIARVNSQNSSSSAARPSSSSRSSTRSIPITASESAKHIPSISPVVATSYVESNYFDAQPYDQCFDQYQAMPYKWANYIPFDPVLVEAREKLRVPTEEELKGTAFVTMATGDSAARAATVLMQVRWS